MKRQISTLVFAALVAAGACNRDNGRPADTTLNSDLSLAAQQRGYQLLDTLSPAERARANALNGAAAPVVAAPTHATASSGEVSHTRHRSGATAGAATTTTTTTSGGTMVKNTKRDAAIGAAAGAVLGATTSRSKVKGGLIGAAVGGLLGGVIGNNVDKHKKP